MAKSRSEILGLKRMKKATPQACHDRAKQLDKNIQKGKYTGKTLVRAKQYRSWCMAEARRGGVVPPRGFDPKQMHLPGFLSSQKVVGLHELRAIAKKIDQTIKVVAKLQKRKSS